MPPSCALLVPPTPSYCLLLHPFSAWILLVSLGYFAWSIAFQTFWCPELPSRPNRVCAPSCSLCSDPNVPKPHAFLARNKQLHSYTFCFLFLLSAQTMPTCYPSHKLKEAVLFLLVAFLYVSPCILAC